MTTHDQALDAETVVRHVCESLRDPGDDGWMRLRKARNLTQRDGSDAGSA